MMLRMLLVGRCVGWLVELTIIAISVLASLRAENSTHVHGCHTYGAQRPSDEKLLAAPLGLRHGRRVAHFERRGALWKHDFDGLKERLEPR